MNRSVPASQLQLFEPRDPAQPWHVRVSRRARRLSVRVYPGGKVEVVVPPNASAATVERFVGTHRRWIDERVADLSALSGASLDSLPTRIELAALERTFRVDYRPTQSREVRVVGVGEGCVIVAGAIADEHEVAHKLQRWLMGVAQVELSRAVASLAAEHGFTFDRVQIRRQRTRWGSCSARGTISLNVCGLFQEPAVLRYLLLHELSHTRHMNHSRRFWALVESIEPDYQRLDRELLQGWQRVPGWMFR